MIEFLKKVPLFSKMTDDQINTISNICKEEGHRAGTILFREKEPGATFYMVQEGAVKIFTSSTNGEDKILSLFKAGDSFGELSLIDGGPRSASASTVEDSKLFCIDAKHFLKLMADNFDIAHGIMRSLSGKLREANNQIHDLTFLDARARVIKALIRLVSKGGTRKGDAFVIQMTLNYDEISQMAGVDRAVLNQVVRDLHEKQILFATPTEMQLNLAKLR